LKSERAVDPSLIAELYGKPEQQVVAEPAT
jgi:hypothetical protein